MTDDGVGVLSRVHTVELLRRAGHMVRMTGSCSGLLIHVQFFVPRGMHCHALTIPWLKLKISVTLVDQARAPPNPWYRSTLLVVLGEVMMVLGEVVWWGWERREEYENGAADNRGMLGDAGGREAEIRNQNEEKPRPDREGKEGKIRRQKRVSGKEMKRGGLRGARSAGP